jgi:hypothetical protein
LLITQDLDAVAPFATKPLSTFLQNRLDQAVVERMLERMIGRMIDVKMKPPIVALAVFWILLFGFLIRAQTFRVPVFDHHNWRQADTAQIARNFWRERFNPLFPQVDQRGAQEHGYVETGFEIYAFAIACVARVAGFHPEIGRALNSLLFVGSGLLVFRFLARRYDATAALIGLFVYAFGLPLSLFLDRAFMSRLAARGNGHGTEQASRLAPSAPRGAPCSSGRRRKGEDHSVQ